MVDLYSTSTEYLANALTIVRGTAADIESVGVYHTEDPDEVPADTDFTPVTLVSSPTDPLADGNNIDVLSLMGTGALALAAGTYQRWVMVKTATETIIRKVDVVEVL